MLTSRFELTVTNATAFGQGTTEDGVGAPAPLAVAVAGGLVLTGLVFWLCCPFPSPGALTWTDLGDCAAGYMVAALAAYSILLRVGYRLFGDQLELPFPRVMYQTWASAGFAPLLALLEHQHSPWITVVPVVVAVQITIFLRHATSIQEGSASSEPIEEHGLLLQGCEVGATREIRPALITSIVFQFGAGLLALGCDLLAGMCFAAAIVYPTWKLAGRAPVRSDSLKGAGRFLQFLRKSLLPMTLVALALLPYLRNPALAESFVRLLKLKIHKPVPVAPLRRGSFYSGLILLPPTKPIKQLLRLPSQAATAAFGSTLRRPLEIEFDGVYWYFQPPDERPLPDAPIVHGNPARDTIRSTVNEPVAMVANQTLNQAIAVTCCRALRVEIIDGEGSLGPIHLEVILKNTGVQRSAPALSLGDLPVPSSAEHHEWIAQHPVDETLTFLFPRTTRLKEFDEITIAVRPSNYLADRGAHIAIQRFTLVP